MTAPHQRAMSPLDELLALEDRARIPGVANYHKVKRRYLGVPVPAVTELANRWRAALDVPGRVSLAAELWASDIHEARIAAAKLLTQARLRPDEEAWQLIRSWVPDFDGWAIADHACDAGNRRLLAEPARIAAVEPWTLSDHMLTRRAALVITLPWARMNHPGPADSAIRERVLGWVAGYIADNEWFIQKAVAWWLRDLSKHDPARVRRFLAEHGAAMKPFALKDAARLLPEED